MAELCAIVGNSGSGKSTSIRNLDPKSTFIINIAKKALPFKGFKKRTEILFSKLITPSVQNKNLILGVFAIISKTPCLFSGFSFARTLQNQLAALYESEGEAINL